MGSGWRKLQLTDVAKVTAASFRSRGYYSGLARTAPSHKETWRLSRSTPGTGTISERMRQIRSATRSRSSLCVGWFTAWAIAIGSTAATYRERPTSPSSPAKRSNRCTAAFGISTTVDWGASSQALICLLASEARAQSGKRCRCCTTVGGRGLALPCDLGMRGAGRGSVNAANQRVLGTPGRYLK